MFSPLVDKRLMNILALHFNTFGQIYPAVKSYNPDNEEIITYPAPDPSVGTIRCYIERLQNSFVGELREKPQIIFTDAFNIALNGYFPQISQGDQFVAENGQRHNIHRVMHDDSKTYTTLVTELVNQPEM